MPRVFAALLLPHDVCDALARDAKAFARIDPLARFTRSTNLHLTLAFVGEISTIDARRLSAALRPLSALTPRDITIGRIGTFDRQRILYAGLSPAESLDPVVNEVRSTITRLGLPLDDKLFRAHMTLVCPPPRASIPLSLKAAATSAISALPPPTALPVCASRLPATGAAAIRP